MCGRYNLTDSPALHVLLDELGLDIGPLPVRYNIAPTEPALTIYRDSETNRLTVADMRWWLTPSWSDGPSQKYVMFNARSETVSTSRAFRGPFKYHRAIVPAASFIEWQRHANGKQAFEISSTDHALAFAAIWDLWEGDGNYLQSCAIITRAADPGFASIHSRQPVLLDAASQARWLDPETPADELKAILQQDRPLKLSAQPVDRAIGNARNKNAPLACGEAIEIG